MVNIMYDDPQTTSWVRIKQDALTWFLRFHEVSEQRIASLTIHLCERLPERYHKQLSQDKHTTLGLYDPNTEQVYVMVWPDGMLRTPKELNQTLLHEVRHWMRGRVPRKEWELPYRERPSEIDARIFASAYAPGNHFVAIDAAVVRKCVAILAGGFAVLVLSVFGMAKLIGRMVAA